MDGQEFSLPEEGQDLDSDQWLKDLQGDLHGSSLLNDASRPDTMDLPISRTAQGGERASSFDLDQFLKEELGTMQTHSAQSHNQPSDAPQIEHRSAVTVTQAEEVTAKIVAAVGLENPQNSNGLQPPTNDTDPRAQDTLDATASEGHYTFNSTLPYQLPGQLYNFDASLLARLNPSIADADPFTNCITQRLPSVPAQTQWPGVDPCQTVPQLATGDVPDQYEIPGSSQSDLLWLQEPQLYGMNYPQAEQFQADQTPDLTGTLSSLSGYGIPATQTPFWIDGSQATAALPPVPALEPYPSGQRLNNQAARDTSVSSTESRSSTDRGRPRTSYTDRFTAQKPKVNAKTPWVRVNATTEGKSTRSGKLNQYDASTLYTMKEHPLGDWRTSTGHSFKYSSSGELSRPTYSTSRLREFLYEHPRRLDGLILWIQRSPADSARRYPTPDSSKCRFEQCPAHQQRLNGNILHGHYRVAFDEKYAFYGEDTDPFLVAGYVHLYCLERFMDLPELCSLFDIRIDTRVMFKEPNHRFAAAIEGPDAVVGKRFVELCRTGKLSDEYPRYPVHAAHPDGFAKQHKHTLTYAMTKAKIKSRPPARRKDREKQDVPGSQIEKHLGDLEMFCEARVMVRKSNQGKRARGEEIEEQPTQAQEVSQVSHNLQGPRQLRASQLSPQDQSHELPESSQAVPMPKRRKARPPEPQQLLSHAVNDTHSTPAAETWHRAYKAVQSTFRTDFNPIDYSAATTDNGGDEIEEISPYSLPQRKRRRSAIVYPDAALELPNKRAKLSDGASLLAASESEYQSMHETVESDFNDYAAQLPDPSPDDTTRQTQFSQPVSTADPSPSPPAPLPEQHRSMDVKDEPVDSSLNIQELPAAPPDMCLLGSPNSLFGSPVPSPTDPQRTASPDNQEATVAEGLTAGRGSPSPRPRIPPQDGQDTKSPLAIAETGDGGDDQDEWADFEDMLNADCS